jgi:hypothetical protein
MGKIDPAELWATSNRKYGIALAPDFRMEHATSEAAFRLQREQGLPAEVPIREVELRAIVAIGLCPVPVYPPELRREDARKPGGPLDPTTKRAEAELEQAYTRLRRRDRR